MLSTRHKTATVIAAVAAAGIVLVPASPVNAADHGPMHDGTTRLHHAKGFPNARGAVAFSGGYDSHHAGMKEEFHLVLRGVKKLAGERLEVFVHGDLVGGARVNDNGRARLHRHDDVGDMHDGWRIRVRTRSGKLVAYSSFRRAHGRPHVSQRLLAT